MALQPLTHLSMSDTSTQVTTAEPPKLPSVYDADDWSNFLKRTGVLKGWTVTPDRAEMGSRAALAIAPVDGSYESIYQEIDRTYVQSIKDSDEVKQSLSRYNLRETGLSAGISGGVPNAMANLQAGLDRQNAMKSDIQVSVKIAADQVETFYVGMELTLEENLKVSPECIRFFRKSGNFSNATDHLKEFGRIFGLKRPSALQTVSRAKVKSVKLSNTLKDISDETQKARNVTAEMGITAPPVSGKLAWNRKTEKNVATTESHETLKEVTQQMTVGLLLNDEWQPSSDPLSWKVVRRGEATPIVGLLYGIACEEPRDSQLIDSITQLCHEHNRQLLAATASKWTVKLSFREDEVAVVSLFFKEVPGRLVQIDSVYYDTQSQHFKDNNIADSASWRRTKGGHPHIFGWAGVSFRANCQREGEDIKFKLDMPSGKFSFYDIDAIKFDSVQSRHAIRYMQVTAKPSGSMPIAFEVVKTFLTQPKSMPMIEVQSPSIEALEAPLPISSKSLW